MEDEGDQPIAGALVVVDKPDGAREHYCDAPPACLRDAESTGSFTLSP